MKITYKSVSVLVFVAAAALAGCGKSPVEAFCAKGAECGQLGSQTEEQCVTNTNKNLEPLRKDASCSQLSEKFEAFLDCGAGLSCADLKSNEASTAACQKQFSDF